MGERFSVALVQTRRSMRRFGGKFFLEMGHVTLSYETNMTVKCWILMRKNAALQVAYVAARRFTDGITIWELHTKNGSYLR